MNRTTSAAGSWMDRGLRFARRQSPAPWKSSGLIVLLAVLAALRAMAEAEAPDEGLAAEGEGRWSDAVSIYRTAISNDPQRVDLWRRIAVIEGSLGHSDAEAFARQQEAAASPPNAGLHFLAAQAYSIANNPAKALESIDQALALDPKNLQYLNDRALYANWAGKVDVAAETFERILELTPTNSQALFNLAGARSWKGTPEDRLATAAALERAAALNPNDAALQNRVAQAYAMAEKPVQAFAAIERALVLQPDNVEYLRSKAQYANWLGNGALAGATYERILALAPNDDEALVNNARAKSWAGKQDQAVQAFKKYLKGHPEDKDAWMDYIRAQEWRGNYAAALRGLEEYRKRFAPTRDYRDEKARVLASAGRPAAAMEIIGPRLEETPDDYGVNYSHTIALQKGNRPREALDSLNTLEALRPESRETQEMRDDITADLRSNVSGTFEDYRESNSLIIRRYRVEGGIRLNPSTRISAGAEQHDLKADKGSGLENPNGERNAKYTKAQAGLRHVFFPALDVDLRGGLATTDNDEDRFIYRASAVSRFNDSLGASLHSAYDFYTVSPRAVSLGIRQQANTLHLQWTPDVTFAVITDLSYDHFSDSNSRWTALLSPRATVLRSDWVNLDLGPQFLWYGFDNDLDNGYYDPSHFERYALNGFAYVKLGAKNGVGVSGSAGEQRDDSESDYVFGTDYSIEGQFSAYREWLLRLRYGNTHNGRTISGNYDADVLEVQLTKRF